jgi:plasmid stabilization system protein ParE
MRHRLIIRPEAEAELQEAFDWYEHRVPGLGADFLRAVDAVVASILDSPFQYPAVYRHVRRALTRRFPYQILLTVEEDSITVLAVFHAARDPKRWQDRV